MIKHLLIKNYALIELLEITPSASLNVITGETGAGKSIMLGALGLLLGKRADKKALFDEENKCIVEGTFDITTFNLKKFFEENDLDFQDECIIRREITSSGKSRAFINDTPATLDVVRKLGESLVDIHSQHDTLLLSESGFQLAIIDQYGDHQKNLEDYQTAFKDYKIQLSILNKLQNELSEIKNEYEFNNFILQELIASNLVQGEETTLESELEILENGEEIKSRFKQAVIIAEENEFSVSDGLDSLVSELKPIKDYSSSYEELYNRVVSLQIELSDVISEIRNTESNIEIDEEELMLKRDRTDLIQRLLQKHSMGSVKELIEFQEKISEKVSKVDNFDDELNKAESQLLKSKTKLSKEAALLTKSRTGLLRTIETKLVALLQKVGIPNASISIEHAQTEPGPNGADQINLLFSANKGIAPQPLKNVASGGEFSRLMFCIKSLVADKSSLPTMIFDEIDTGVSGEIALKMISLMKEMATKHQIISISHLPQFAAGADTHYFVYKDDASSRSISKMKKLSTQERIENIAKMIGGTTLTDSSVQSAKELLSLS